MVYARNLRDRNPRLIARYPDRAYYLSRNHRRARRAILYRLVPCGPAFSLVPVRPLEPTLLLFDRSREAHAGACAPGEIERPEPPSSQIPGRPAEPTRVPEAAVDGTRSPGGRDTPPGRAADRPGPAG